MPNYTKVCVALFERTQFLEDVITQSEDVKSKVLQHIALQKRQEDPVTD